MASAIAAAVHAAASHAFGFSTATTSAATSAGFGCPSEAAGFFASVSIAAAAGQPTGTLQQLVRKPYRNLGNEVRDF